MFQSHFFVAICFCFLAALSTPALAQQADQQEVLMSSASSSILKDIRSEVKKCVERPTAALQFKSTCSSLILISKTEAQVLVGNEWYTAKISVSNDADGGDLDNLKVYNSLGEFVAQHLNVVAYDSVVYAMLGGPVHMSEHE